MNAVLPALLRKLPFFSELSLVNRWVLAAYGELCGATAVFFAYVYFRHGFSTWLDLAILVGGAVVAFEFGHYLGRTFSYATVLLTGLYLFFGQQVMEIAYALVGGLVIGGLAIFWSLLTKNRRLVLPLTAVVTFLLGMIGVMLGYEIWRG